MRTAGVAARQGVAPRGHKPIDAFVRQQHEHVQRTFTTAVAAVILATAWWPPIVGDRRSWGLPIVLAVVAGSTALLWRPAGSRRMRVAWSPLLLAELVAVVTVTGGADSPYLVVLLLQPFAAALSTPRAALARDTVLALTAYLWLRTGVQAGPGTWARALPTVLLAAVLVALAERTVARFRAQAQTDGLTGLWNHVSFYRLLDAERERSRRSAHPLSSALLMIDVDDFKRVNDVHGHPVGDRVLAAIGSTLRERLRASDIAARYGGEEFAVLLTDTDRATAVEVAEAIRERIPTGVLEVPVTVSIGIAASDDLPDCTPEQLVAAADRALLQAKRTGRDRVAVAGPSDTVGSGSR